MSDHKPHKPDPVSLVLGPTPPGPFALLGLPATDVSLQQVLGSLHVRLEQVNASPHAATPAAEDVRLALHAAAAQLCDPAVRRLLLGTWAGDGRAPAQGERDDGISDRSVAIERDLHIAVGLSGGWNGAAMQRLALACEARGVGLDELAAVLAGLGSKRTTTSGAMRRVAHPRPPTRGGVAAAAKVESRVPRELLLLTGAGAGLVVLVVIALVMLTGPTQETATPRQVAEVLEGGLRSATPLVMEEERRTAADMALVAPTNDLAIGDARTIEREFVALATALGQKDQQAPDARSRFSSAFGSFAENWHLLRRDETTAILSALVDLAFAASQQQRESELVVVLIEPLTTRAADRRSVRALAAAGSSVARLLQERDLPRGMRQQLETALRSNIATSGLGPVAKFDVAAEQVVLPLASALASSDDWSSTEAWRGFLDVRDAALGDRVRGKDAATLAGLQGVMRRGGASDTAPDAGADAASLLAGALSWTKSSELRAAVLGWFDDPAVPTARLAAVMRAMVKSSVRGVDSTMVLAASADAERRQELRAQVAAALQDDAAGPGAEAVRAWAAAADSLLALDASTPESMIDLAARLAELTAARTAQLDGRADEASALITSAATPTPLPAATKARELPAAAASSKAMEYLQLGPSQSARADFWKKAMAEGRVPDLLLARMAIEEAGRGSPATVRDAARDYVRARFGDEAVVLAAVDLVFSIPESPENLQWLSDIAQTKIAWRGRGATRDAAHLALLEAAAGLFATRVDAPALEAVSERLARSWLASLGETEGDNAVTPTEAIRRLTTRLLAVQRDTHGTHSDARRRLEARLAIARGTLQECVWWQAAAVEVIGSEAMRRTPATPGRAVLERWNNDRRRAHNAFQQILAGERAALRLLRAEVDAATGGGA
ncbi:MAG TPA: hypothetical protein VF777_08440 [Phycisphaerales bacterium]